MKKRRSLIKRFVRSVKNVKYILSTLRQGPLMYRVDLGGKA